MRAKSLVGTCITIGVAVAASASCGGDDMSCASVVSFAEPVLTIRSVTGPDGAPVGTVEVTRLRRDGRPGLADVRSGLRLGTEWMPGLVTSSSDLHWNIRSSGGRLLCDVPCAFGSFTAEHAQLRVASDGADATWRGALAYGTSRGCGPTVDDGVDLELTLGNPG